MSFLLALGITVFFINKNKMSWPKALALFLITNYLLLNLGEWIYLFSYGINTNDTLSTFALSAVILSIVTFVYYFMKNPYAKYLREWENAEIPVLTSVEFSDLLYDNCDLDNIRYHENIPYNRALYFSSGTEADVEMENVSLIFYDAAPSDNEMSFQEYGFLVTSAGVIVKQQIELPGDDKDNKYDVETIYFPFANAFWFTINNDILTVYYSDKTKVAASLDENDSMMLGDIFDIAINSGWTKHSESVLNEGVTTEDELENRMNDLDSAIEKANRAKKIKDDADISAAGSIGGSLGSINEELNLNQINDRFGAGQGHGHAGEQFGDLKDALLGRTTEKLGGNHDTLGADRIVNGRQIQTKYHATAGKSINSCFYSSNESDPNLRGKGKYIDTNTNTMMPIEVPKDQYSDAVKRMARKIKEGNVPGETDPANAAKFVKKGALTYEQAQIATKSIFDRKSTIQIRDNNNEVVRDSNGEIMYRDVTLGEKLVWSAGGDFLTGATAALPFAAVSGVWVYCNSIWQGADKKTALKHSAIAAAKPCLTGGVIYMVSSQFAGSQIGKNVGNLYAKHILKRQVSNKAKTQMATKGTMGVITVAITVGPDLTDCLRGRISVNQLVKNAVTTGGGLAGGAGGATLGTFILPGIGTAVGTVIGGALGGSVAREVMNNFIEDDAVNMIRIAKEEFIDTVMMSGLSQEEFQTILDETFLHKKFNKQLKVMYAASDSRTYIHDVFLAYVEQVITQRDLPSEEELSEVVALQYEQLLIAA